MKTINSAKATRTQPASLASTAAAISPKVRKQLSPVTPGLAVPAKGRSGPVTVLGWRDTDKKGSKPTYFLDVRMIGWPSHELLGVSPLRIKALGEALLDLYDNLPKPTRVRV